MDQLKRSGSRRHSFVNETSEFLKNNNNLSEIEELRTLNVWSECQDVLEQQALNELEIFTEQNCSSKGEQVSKDGEISGKTESTINPKPIGDNVLNLESYIKRQEELRKHLEYKRSLRNEQVRPLSHHSQKHLKRKAKNAVSTDTSEVHKPKKPNCANTRVEINDKSDSEYIPSGTDEHNSDSECDSKPVTKIHVDKKSKANRILDDGCLKLYKQRLEKYYAQLEDTQNPISLLEDINLQGLKVPAKMWNNLYSYQQDGVEWLWKIHQMKSGGLLGDEMGLGKTVQVIVFLAALEHSKVYASCYIGLGPTLIVVPATVVHQWVKHFHEWAPEFRVAILHQSGSFAGENKTDLVKEINKCRGVLITTYHGVLRYKACLADYQWDYLILDEGHKIRNAAAKVTVAIKQLRTPHRLMLTGSPMQNNLQELWSLFDFIESGLLGTSPTFMEHFNNPIVQGGFANATPMQEATALSVATALKNMISPHLLRRTKAEVNDDIKLPNKSEQVLFCSLTPEQHDLYKRYLLGEHVSMILGKGVKNWFSEKQTRANILVAITTLRKICNHPDMYLSESENNSCNNPYKDLSVEESHDYYRRSGKMIVVAALLKIWKKQNHRVLFFTQGRAVVRLLESFLNHQEYKYLKMDGSTCVSARQPLINKFNTDTSYDVFLSTTRVGGLGINLTGANRVIIYDPDWNPATDTQARERAWRIGQDKQVTVYRLICAGTIEEKMYQRQVWKQLLTNKILIDPRTQKFFKTSDLHDLFSLPDHIDDSNLETANIFKNSRVNLQERIDKKRRRTSAEIPDDATFSDEKLLEMKKLAERISKNIATTTHSDNTEKNLTTYQKELKEERQKKLHEKESLKRLAPMELRILNRRKAEIRIEPPVNKIDDSKTSITFSKALNISEKKASLYHSKTHKSGNNFNPTSVASNKDIYKKNVSDIEKCTKSEKRKNKRKRKNSVIDNSGEVDGEHVEGLVKTEIKKKDKVKHKSSTLSNATQDQYVLQKLFSRKGVHSALQHDVIVQSGRKENNIKIHYEAQQRTDLALQALKKSRLDAWRW